MQNVSKVLTVLLHMALGHTVVVLIYVCMVLSQYWAYTQRYRQ